MRILYTNDSYFGQGLLLTKTLRVLDKKYIISTHFIFNFDSCRVLFNLYHESSISSWFLLDLLRPSKKNVCCENPGG